MTALTKYARLEATALWRARPEDQRRDVVVSIGDATLVITDMKDQALTHWSLAAVARANPGQMPAIFHPDGDTGETLELGADETEMIEAIEKLRLTIERRRPHPGRLRWLLTGATMAGLAALAVFWLPDAMLRHTVSVVPLVKRAEIGQALLGRITRVSGQPCADPAGVAALSHLSARVLGPDGARLVVLPAGIVDTAHLPGRTILLNRALVEDPEDPEVTAGFVLVEAERARAKDPLEALLLHAGIWSSLRLLTTGALTDEVLDAYAEYLVTAEQAPLPDTTLLDAFKAAELRTTPYAYALDVSGEATLGLIEADPYSTTPKPILSDGDWLRLQAICGG